MPPPRGRLVVPVVALASPTDVEARIGRALTEDEKSAVGGLLDEAAAMVEGYLGREVQAPVPKAVTIVVSRMVARVLESPTDGFAAESLQQTAGPFSHSVRFAAGASGGSPWLTAGDRMTLRRYRRSGGVYSMELR